LTLAFQILADPRHAEHCAPSALLAAIHELGYAAGTRGMVGGQAMDMQAERRVIDPQELDYIHTHKTAKLITAALRMGAVLASAAPEQLAAVTTYGESIGLAFQIVDDILDLEGNAAELGKNTRSDLHRHKATYPAMYGIGPSKTKAQHLIQNAKQSLQMFGERAYYFSELADFIQSRTH
jgi:geranylgeranyl diphosphate synthase type II